MHPVAHWLVSSPWAHLAEMLLILLGALALGPRTEKSRRVLRRYGLPTRSVKLTVIGGSTPAITKGASRSTTRRGRGGTLTFEQLSRTVTPTKRHRGYKQRSHSTVYIASVGGGACINPGSGPNGDAA